MRAEAVYLIPAKERDRWGNEIGDQADDVLLGYCVVWPRESEEQGSGEIFLDGFNVLIKNSPRRVRPDDRLRVRDDVHEVDGTPGEYLGKGTVVKTRRVST